MLRSILLGLLCLVCLLNRALDASATVSCAVTITSPANGATIGSPFTLVVQDACPAGTKFFNRLYFNGKTYDFQGASIALPAVPNGGYTAVVVTWDLSGLIKYGMSAGINFQVTNGNQSSPGPTPGQTPQPSPTSNVNPSSFPDSAVILSRSPIANLGWLTDSRGATYSNGCVHPPQSATTVQGPMAAINFEGTGITLYGQIGPNFGIGAYALDGGPLTTVDAYSPTDAFPTPLVNLSNLTDEAHVLSYQVTCNKNPASVGYYQTLVDYAVNGSRNPFSKATVYDKSAGNVTFSGNGWTCGTSVPENIGGVHCWDGEAGDSVSWTFTGSLIEVFVRPDVGDGYFDVQIDGQTVARNVSGQYSTTDNDQLDAWMAFAQGGLLSGPHTIKLTVDGTAPYPNESEDSGQKNLLQFDVGLAFP